MLVGAWGAQAGVLLERAAERRGEQVHRVSELTMLSPPDLIEGDWCCWLFGEPEDRGELAARFLLETPEGLAAAFGRALAELGERACELLWGRFVVVMLERGRIRCTVARDQLGAQPLIHARTAGGLLFSEHECDLLDLLPRTPDADRLALLQWIENGLTPTGRTLYEGVCRLPAGHRLKLDKTHTSVERWWNLRYEDSKEGSVEALAERMRDASLAAVGRAAYGSEHPAVKLSGGLDSACVAAGLSANSYADGRALAIGGTFSAYPVTDERELIEATAHHAHLPLKLVAFDEDSSMLGPAVEHISRWRVPPGTPNLFLWQPVMARARELGVDRMLDGEGGDELFGLAPYLIADMIRAGRLPTAWSLTRLIPGLGSDPDRSMRLRVLRHYGLRPLVPNVVQRHRERRRAASSRSLISPADTQALIDLEIAGQENRDGPAWWRFKAESLIDTRDRLDMGGHFRREAVEEKIDRRHPFLYDLQLIEAVLRLPPRPQFDPSRDRPLLREALRGLIPETVRTRHMKSHFTPLVLAGIQADESELIKPLEQADAPVRAFVAREALDRELAIPPIDRALLGAGPLWRVAIANRWLVSQAGGSS